MPWFFGTLIFILFSKSQAEMREFDNIVLVHISDSLVSMGRFIVSVLRFLQLDCPSVISWDLVVTTS